MITSKNKGKIHVKQTLKYTVKWSSSVPVPIRFLVANKNALLWSTVYLTGIDVYWSFIDKRFICPLSSYAFLFLVVWDLNFSYAYSCDKEYIHVKNCRFVWFRNYCIRVIILNKNIIFHFFIQMCDKIVDRVY